MATATKTTRLDRVYAAAKQLTPRQRCQLVSLIVPSLPGLKSKPLSGTILDQRREALRSGRDKGVTIPEMMAKARRIIATGKRA